MAAQFQQAAQASVKEIYDKLFRSCDGSCEELSEAIVLRHFAPLEAQLVEANSKYQSAETQCQKLIRDNARYVTERDEARREVAALSGKIERLVCSTGSKDLGDLCDRIEQWQSKAQQSGQLSADNQRLREALIEIRDEHHKTMQEVKDVGYSDGLCLKPSLFLNISKSLSTPQPSAVDLELQARKAKALDYLIKSGDRLEYRDNNMSRGWVCQDGLARFTRSAFATPLEAIEAAMKGQQ